MVVNNPNNWHWVDKNCIDWTRQYFKDKLVGFTLEDGGQKVEITSVKELEGDVEVCQRKGKVISLFDFNLILDIVCNDKIKGTISVPEISYDSEEDDYQFEISLDGSLNETDNLKKVVRQKLIPELRRRLYQFGTDLIITHGSDVQISLDQVKSKFTADNQKASVKTTSQSSTFINKSTSAKPEAVSVQQKSSLYNTTNLQISTVFNTTAEQIYLTLLDPQRVAAWTRSAPVIQPKEDTEFQLFGGNIQGKILKLVPNKSIQMLWRLNDWKQGHYTTLNIDLKQNDSDTSMNVEFQGVPIGDEEKVKDNFENYYIKSIKITFGFGAIL